MGVNRPVFRQPSCRGVLRQGRALSLAVTRDEVDFTWKQRRFSCAHVGIANTLRACVRALILLGVAIFFDRDDLIGWEMMVRSSRDLARIAGALLVGCLVSMPAYAGIITLTGGDPGEGY